MPSQSSIDSPVSCSAAEGYERWASTYDDFPNPLLAREERYLLPRLGDIRRKRILDLACGTGRWLERLETQGCGCGVGIDCSPAMLDVARNKCNIAGKLTQGHCERLPFSEETFDLAICSFALGHISALDPFAAEVARVSRPGADLFVTDLHPKAIESGWAVGFRDRRSAVSIQVFPRQSHEVIAAFSSQGFKLVSEVSLWLGEPEQTVFARAGKIGRFAAASEVPAVIVFHFRRFDGSSEVWET